MSNQVNIKFKTLAELRKEFAGIKRAAASLDKRIQTAGVSVLYHLSQHRDVTVVNEFFLSLAKGQRKTALASWLLAYGAVQVNAGENKDTSPFTFDKEKTTDHIGASLDPWTDHKPEKPVDQVFDVQKAVKAMLRRASNATELENGNYDALVKIAEAVGIPSSDVPTGPKAPAAPKGWEVAETSVE